MEVQASPRRNLIQDLPLSQRPRERLRDLGAKSLRDDELIAILLRTGFTKSSVMEVAANLLMRFGGLAGLARASYDDLCEAPGLGPAKAAELQAAMTLGIRAAAVAAETRRLLSNPELVAEMLLNEMTHFDHEVVRVLALDTRLRLLRQTDVYKGSVHSTAVRHGELLRDAVKINASAVIVVHNHPSGDPAPSAADVAMTKGLIEAGRLLDIDVHDHMVVGGGRYVSMRASGLGFSK
jgi:DNA repair protein RadC